MAGGRDQGSPLGAWRVRKEGTREQYLDTCSLCIDMSLAAQFLTALEANDPDILKSLIARGEATRICTCGVQGTWR